MAATLKFEFTISEHTSFTHVGVAITIDERRTPGNHEDDVPIDMKPDGNKLKWTGSHKLPTDQSMGLFVHVEYRGTPGKQWHLKVVSDRPDTTKENLVLDKIKNIPSDPGDWSFWVRLPQ